MNNRLLLGVSLLLLSFTPQTPPAYPYKDPHLPVEKRVTDLLSRMTPVLFIEEGLHGYSGFGSTSFPIPLQLASAWDTSLVYSIGRAIATETRAHGVDMILGPVLCLPHDPRWGRVEETYGEDPYLSARYAVAMVRGMQGGDVSRPDAVVAEPKHFAVHGIPEAGSNTAPVNIGEREARSNFLYVFEKAVREGGALSMMAAYSEIDGIPCVANKWLLTDVLRKEWGFKGFVLSDLGAIKMSLENHRVAVDIADALAQTEKAGLNMQFYDFAHPDFMQAMKKAVSTGALPMAILDKSVGDVLRVKFLLGLFDRPYVDTTLRARVFHSDAHQQLSLQAAQKSICLLKNDGGVLPFKNIHSLAVIGPLAASTYLGGYSNEASKAISILDGLQQRAGSAVAIHYEPGYVPDPAGARLHIVAPAPDTAAVRLLNQAVEAARQAEATIVVLGEENNIVGEGKDRAGLDLSAQQMELVRALKSTGKPVVVVLSNGRPLTINWVAANMPAIVETWFGGEKSGLAVADVLLGNVNPSGKLPMTFPRSVGQIPFYYDHKPTSGHHYVDESDTPLFPFGHGLSYTHFDYSGLSVSPASISVGDSAEVLVHVRNTGSVAGAEIVQLYVRDEIGSVTTPERALKGFGRVMLQPGEDKVVTFRLRPEQLSLWNREMHRVVEPGTFTIMVGSSSSDIRLTDSLEVKNDTLAGLSQQTNLSQQTSRHSPTTLYPTYNGLVMAGYQGWFRAAGDGSAAGRYAYGDPDRSGIDLWPDVSEYARTYETPFKLADGKKARFFSSLDQSTTDLHFKWMQQYGIDGVFMQRFFGETRPGTHKKESVIILQHALEAASKYRRAIAVMYDLSGLRGHGEDCSTIIDDWKYLVDSIRVTNQEGEKTYLHHRGKPVVVIWGVGFPDRPYDIRNIGLSRLMDFLQHDPVYGGCAVMLGVPTFWRDLNADCVHDSYLHELIRRADLIMPWTVQRFSPLLHNDMDRYRDVMLADMQWCDRNHVDYVPCVYPGFSWHNLSVHEFPDDIKPVGSIPRQGGRFYWQLLSTAIKTGAKMLYVAMFDEVNEGTAIFKASDNPPTGGNVQFIDMDHKPSDTYLWLTGEAGRMLRGEKPLSFTMPERK